MLRKITTCYGLVTQMLRRNSLIFNLVTKLLIYFYYSKENIYYIYKSINNSIHRNKKYNLPL